VEGGGGGAGAGGFCASATGIRSAIEVASKTKMRVRWPIDRCLRTKHQYSKMLERMSVQVKPHCSKNGTAWMLQCIDELWLDNAIVQREGTTGGSAKA